MADNNINQDNPFEGVFERREQERQQASEQIRQQKEQINNERKLHIQRVLANKQGGELAKILSVINPNLAPLGLALGTTAEFAKVAYQALDEMSAKLVQASASAKLLGVSIAGLEGAGEMHNDIEELKTKWRSFTGELNLGIAQLYNNAKNGIDYKSMSNDELAGMSLFSLNTLNIPVLLGIEEELEKREKAEKEVVDTLHNYKNALNSQINNIENNDTLTRTELLNLSSTGINTFKGAGVGNSVDQERWTSKALGLTEMLYRQMDESIAFDKIYEDVLSYYTNGSMESLHKYGIGITEEFLAGYAQKEKSMYLGNGMTYREDKMIEARFGALDTYVQAMTDGDEELIQALYDNGYQIKNNTNALQKWQWIESISSVSSEKGSSSYRDYLAVDKNGKDITDEVFGTVGERFNEYIKENVDYLNNSKALILSDMYRDAGINVPVFDPNKETDLDRLIANNVVNSNKSNSNRVMTLDELIANDNKANALDNLNRSIQVNISTSDNLKAEIEETTSRKIYDTIQNSYTFRDNTKNWMERKFG